MGLLRTSARFIDVRTTRNMPAVGTATDLAPRCVGRRDCRRLFLHPHRAVDLRLEAPRCRFRMGVLGVRALHHGVRRRPRDVDHHALVSGLWHRRHRQGDDGGGVDRDGGDAVAAVAESACAALAIAASRRRSGPGAGRHVPARSRRHASAVAEDGSDRTIDRRRGARFQQSAHDHQRQSRDCRSLFAIVERRHARAVDAGDRQRRERRAARGDVDAAPAGVCAEAAARSQTDQRRSIDRRHVGFLQAYAGRECRARGRGGRRPMADRGRPQPAGSGDSQSCRERQGRHECQERQNRGRDGQQRQS